MVGLGGVCTSYGVLWFFLLHIYMVWLGPVLWARHCGLVSCIMVDTLMVHCAALSVWKYRVWYGIVLIENANLISSPEIWVARPLERNLC